MNPAIPPAPGQSDIPPPDADPARDVPPPGDETHVSDVLERRKKFSWKRFGGDGFLVSVAFHAILAILAIFYVVSRYKSPEQRSDPDVFATGAGGGQNGEKPKAYEQKLQTRQTNVKMPTRISSKSASAIALPDTPRTSTTSFSAGLTSGGMSKGAGGGTGGGEGTGIGIGKGGGKNFVSLFGARGLNLPGIPGVFYDCKQYADGRATPFMNDDANETASKAFVNKVLRPFAKSWNKEVLEKYFRAPEPLYASRIFIPRMSADAAPAAYALEGKVKGSRWVIHYKGIVKAPKSGRFRFVVFCDDTMVVRWNNTIVGDGGYTVLGFPGTTKNYGFKVPADRIGLPPGITPDCYKSPWEPPFRCGTWFTVEKGKEYPIELLLSEIPGGFFNAYLLMEEADPAHPAKPAGRPFLFRMSAEPRPEIVQDTGLAIDMDGAELVWFAKSAGPTRVR